MPTSCWIAIDADARSLLASDPRGTPDADEPELRGRAGGEPRTELGGRPVVVAPAEEDGNPAFEGERRRSGKQRDVAGRPCQQSCQLVGNRSAGLDLLGGIDHDHVGVVGQMRVAQCPARRHARRRPRPGS